MEWLIVLFILLLLLFILYQYDNEIEHLINVPQYAGIEEDKPKWSQTKCSYQLNETVSDVLDKNANYTFNHNESDFVLPCGYDYIDKEINDIPISDNNVRRVFIIQGADEITAKNYLWKNIVDYHGIEYAKRISPNTYLLTDQDKKEEIKRLEKEYSPGKKFILKKNIQRQTGLKITNDITEIKNNIDKYVIAQELLEDSYLVNNRKINLRVYIVVICHKTKTDVYIFNDGFMYYTQQEFIIDPKNIDSINHITTGYVDRDVYIKNPLTHTDFKKYLDSDSGTKYHKNSSTVRKLNKFELFLKHQGLCISQFVFDDIKKLIKNVFLSLKGHICRKNDVFNKKVHIYDDYSVQIFGADIAINEKLQAQIIEINKGPDLSPKDERDGSIKKKLMNDVLEIIGLKKKTNNNGLMLVLES